MDAPSTPPPAARHRREDEPLKYTKSVSPLPTVHTGDLESTGYGTPSFPGSSTVGFSSSTSREVPGVLSPLPAHRRGTTSPHYRSEAESLTPFGASRSREPRDFGGSNSKSPLSSGVRGPGIGIMTYRSTLRLALDTFSSLLAQLNKGARTYAGHLRGAFGIQTPASPSSPSPHRTLSLEPDAKPWVSLLDAETTRDFWQNTWPNLFKALAVLQWWFFNVLLILLNKWIYQVGLVHLQTLLGTPQSCVCSWRMSLGAFAHETSGFFLTLHEACHRASDCLFFSSFIGQVT